MAQQLDLQEQEQIDALKAFWAKYGNLIMWSVTLVLAAFAAWTWWTKLERDKAADAEEVEKVPPLCHGGWLLDQPLRLG